MILRDKFDHAIDAMKRYNGRATCRTLANAVKNNNLAAVEWLHEKFPELFTVEQVEALVATSPSEEMTDFLYNAQDLD